MYQTSNLAQSPELHQTIAGYAFSPYDYVMYAFPWGRSGTILADHSGPDEWQKDLLMDIGQRYHDAKCFPDLHSAIQIAIASGHGIGKSALCSWLILWFMSTQTNANIVATANTRAQLLTKLWRELARWHGIAINRDWFEYTATTFYHKEYDRTWRANAIPWSEQNSEAFAGLHEENVFVLYDEASAISDVIWEVTAGAMTTPGALWVALGNPTRNTGRFRECFEGGQFSHRWVTRQIDSRQAKMTNKRQLEEWLHDYGEDSDFARVRVKGQFPRAGSTQFIPSDLVDLAMGREVEGYEDMPKSIGVDVARFGDDRSVIVRRQGTKVEDEVDKYYGLDTMALADKAARAIDDYEPDGVFVDGIGVGAGVVDRLRQMNYDVFDVQVGSKPEDEEKYYNKRAECWGRLRDWLKGAVRLPDGDREVKDDLISLEYGLDARDRIQLEKKSDMKKRGLNSPDIGDALSLTFAEPLKTKRRGHPVPAFKRKTSWRVV